MAGFHLFGRKGIKGGVRLANTNLTQSGATGAIKVYAEVNEIESNGNYRTVYLNMYALPNDGFSGGRPAYWSLTIDDEEYSESTNINGNGMWLYDGYIEVYVEPGTTYAEVDISFTASLYSDAKGSWREVEGSITKISGLSLIADTFITSAKDIDFGENCGITWVPASSSFTYKLSFSFGGYEHTTGVIRPGTTASYTYSELIIPEEEAVNIPNSEYGTVAVSLMQFSDYDGTVPVGASSTKSFRITLKDSAIPVIKSCIVAIDNSANEVVNGWGVALAGFTKVNLSASASGIYGSEIKSFSISGDYRATVNAVLKEGTGEGSEEDTRDYLLNYTGRIIGTSGNKSFKVKCTDTRGRVSEETVTDIISFLPYTAPKARKLSMKKEEFGDSDASNDRMVATAMWTYDPVKKEDKSYNSSYGKIYYKVSTAETWTEHPGLVENNIPFILDELTLSEKVSYNFKVVVTDSIGSTSSKEAFSSTIKVLMDYQAGGMGLGIGKICEIDNVGLGTQSMEVSMDSYFFGEMFIKDKTQTLEDYIKATTKYLVEDVDYGVDDPWDAIKDPKQGQIYYRKVVEG